MAYSLDFKKQVVEEFRNGKTITEISDKYKLAPSTVFFWNKNIGITERYSKYGNSNHYTTEQLGKKCLKLEEENKNLLKRLSELEKKIALLENKQTKIADILLK